MKQVDSRGTLIAQHEKAVINYHFCQLGYQVYNAVDRTSKNNQGHNKQYTFLRCCSFGGASALLTKLFGEPLVHLQVLLANCRPLP